MSETAPTNEPQNPGSLRDFAESRGLDPRSPSSWAKHSNALHEYRTRLAESLGITAEQLHHGLGRLAIQQIE